MRFEQFTGGTYSSWSSNVAADRAINLYPEVVEVPGGKTRMALYSTPGLQTFCTLPTVPVRGLYAGGERLFAVSYNILYEVFIDGTFSAAGPVGSDGPTHSPVQFAANGVQLLISSADQAWLWDGVNPPSVPAVPADDSAPVGSDANTVGTARTIAFQDGYFIAAKPDSKRFFFSALYDGLTWDALEVSAKETYPDNISTLLSDHQELYVFGTDRSTEVWRNEGDPDAAGGFRRDPGGFIHTACIAPWSVCSLADGLHFLGGDVRGRIVAYRLQGFQPQRVSTHAVEQIWSEFVRPYDGYAYTYTEEGHQFWVINFQTDNQTWCYDISTKLWHERAWWNGTSLEKHRGRCHAFSWGRHLVGDHTSGKIYHMSHQLNDDDGVPLRRIRQAPHISNDRMRVFGHRLELDLEINGTAPTAALDWSDDDGATFTAPRSRAPSISGAKRGRVIWRRLGSARDRIYRVTISDNVKVAIADASLILTPGTS